MNKRTFQYLHYEKDGRDYDNCLESIYNLIHDPELVFLRKETYSRGKSKTCYTSCLSITKLEQYINDIQDAKEAYPHKYAPCYHEIIGAGQKHRVYLDLDIDEENLGKIQEPANYKGDKLRYVIDKILLGFADRLTAYTGELIDLKDLVICETPYCEEKKKYSYHIIAKNVYAPDYKYYKVFIQKLQKFLEEFKPFLDNTAKSIQSLRITNCNKPTQPARVKKNISKINREFKDTIISYIPDDAVKLNFSKKEIEPVRQPEDIEVNDEEVKKIIELAEPYLKGAFTYRNTHQGIINFNRIKPSFCEICRRNHDTDNSIFIIRSLVGAIYISCRRDEHKRKKEIGFIENEDEVKEEKKETSKGSKKETISERILRRKAEKRARILKLK